MFVLSIFLLVLFDLAVNYFFAGIFLNNIHYQKPIPPNFLNTLGFSDGNTKWAVTIAIIAIGIKLAKNWHLQQKENLEIIKRKTRTELQIQKARINPAFLFHSLDTIYNKINAGAADSATMVLKLSDLLSYSLYESDTEAVLLDKELTGLRDFIFLEKTRQKNIDMKVSGDTYGKYIAPVLLPLMQECISLVEQEEKNNTGIIFHIISKTESLQVKIFFSFLNGGNTDSLKLGFITDTVRNKLKLINTKGDYHLVLEEPENEKRVTFNFPFTNCIVSEKNLPSQIQMVTHDPA